ncbi:MAG: D-alanyl-D-alanine carboxypeptidase/D-alanyl-D-alanine-endopeptidase, partial [Paramuribaculum sp.]|nr:D-alanyl-D-alanine carboxypeptidase/D-alanyl-D-alanine-endopeptidase [Paramuribaculum sp.]
MITSSIIKSARVILALLALGIATLGVSAENFRPVSDEEIDAMGFDNAGASKLGIYVEDVITGEVLVDYNCADPFIPASVMKAITTASVITLINPSQHFDTRVELCGHRTDGHIFEGNLVVRAVGDPTLESAYFTDNLGMADSIAGRVYALGIDSIAGTVIVDESAMPFNGYPDGWAKEDYMWPYGTAYHTASWRDNRFTLSLPSKTAFPAVEGLEVKVNKKKRGAVKYHYDMRENVVTATGRFPRGAQTTVALAHPDPAAAMRHEIVEKLNERGIGVGAHAADESAAVEKIYSHISPSLLEIMRSLMYRSDNMMAEAMLRAIAPGKPREEACRLEMSLWKLRGCDTDEVAIYDGSGLSRLNRLT